MRLFINRSWQGNIYNEEIQVNKAELIDNIVEKTGITKKQRTQCVL
jgi:hypothetical protein